MPIKVNKSLRNAMLILHSLVATYFFKCSYKNHIYSLAYIKFYKINKTATKFNISTCYKILKALYNEHRKCTGVEFNQSLCYCERLVR